ncbi:MAG: RDD family protein [Armatimonadetes bacterium]|nr:RDD family protein [Armatimonadota bacterium]
MPRELAVRTPENVEITHALAGIGSRFLAVLVDHTIQVALLLLLLFGMGFLVGGLRDWAGGLDDLANLSGWAFALLIAFGFLIVWGYFIYFETAWNGQTPGKRLLNIRVVKDNGSPIDFFSAATRNIVRFIDFLPSSYAIGIIVMFFSPAYKRVGDYAAGTVVVKEYREPKRPRSGVEETPSGERRNETPDPEPGSSTGEEEPPAEVPGVTVSGISRVTREEYDAARRYLDRRGELPKPMGAAFARRIAEPILHRLDMAPESLDDYDYDLFLETLTRDYLRWQDRGY